MRRKQPELPSTLDSQFAFGIEEEFFLSETSSGAAAATMPHAFLEVVDGADHSFALPAAEARVRSAIGEIADAAAGWMSALSGA